MPFTKRNVKLWWYTALTYIPYSRIWILSNFHDGMKRLLAPVHLKPVLKLIDSYCSRFQCALIFLRFLRLRPWVMKGSPLKVLTPNYVEFSFTVYRMAVLYNNKVFTTIPLFEFSTKAELVMCSLYFFVLYHSPTCRPSVSNSEFFHASFP